MDLKYAMIADAINESREGKLNIAGAFESLGAFQFPATHPSMSIVAAFRVRPIDVGKRRVVTIRLLTSDGIEMMHADLPVQIPSSPLGDAPTSVHAVGNLNGLRFEDPGDYAFSIEVDGHAVGSVPLTLIKATLPKKP